nr:delphilin-like [Lytechinus pictus]
MPGRSTSSRASRSVRSSRPSTGSSKRPHKRPPLPMPVNNKNWPKSFGFTIGGDAPTYILSVEPNSHAHAAGLQPGDQLVELNNHSILHLGADSIMTLARRCPEVPPSIVVVSCVKTCEIYRNRNGHFGLTLIGGGPVYVEVVEQGGPAMNCGLKAGDMVLEINGLPIKHSDDAKLFVRGAAKLKMVIIPGAGHHSVKKIAERFEAHAQDRKNKADGFFRKLDAVFYNDPLKKETLLALLKRYAKDKKVDAFGRALAGLLDTPTERKLFEDIRIFVPPKHRDRFDFLVTKDEPARGKRRLFYSWNHFLPSNRILVSGTLGDRSPPALHLFRNYDAPETSSAWIAANQEPFQPVLKPSEQLVWKAARSSGAAPTYFRPMGRFLDGGLIANNPSLDALTEIQEYYMYKRAQGETVRKIGAVVSLGTGLMPLKPIAHVEIMRPNSAVDLLSAAKSLAGGANLIDIMVEQVSESRMRAVDRARAWCYSIGTPFFRFSPPLSQDITMDETRDHVLLKMLFDTQCYIQKNKENIQQMTDLINSL